MGKHHRGYRIRARAFAWLNRPATVPTTALGLCAVVLAVGLTGYTPHRTESADGPHRTPEVRSIRPQLSVAPGAVGGRTEQVASRRTPRPTHTTPVPRPHAVEVSPSAPAWGRSTFNPSALPTRTPESTPSESTSAPVESDPAEPTCEQP